MAVGGHGKGLLLWASSSFASPALALPSSLLCRQMGPVGQALAASVQHMSFQPVQYALAVYRTLCCPLGSHKGHSRPPTLGFSQQGPPQGAGALGSETAEQDRTQRERSWSLQGWVCSKHGLPDNVHPQGMPLDRVAYGGARNWPWDSLDTL